MLIAQVWEKFSFGYQLLNYISKGYHEAFILWKQMRENHSLYKLWVFDEFHPWHIDVKNGLLMGWIWHWIKDELAGFKELMNIFT